MLSQSLRLASAGEGTTGYLISDVRRSASTSKWDLQYAMEVILQCPAECPL